MKKLLNHWNKAGAILLGLAIMATPLVYTGCGTTSTDVLYKSEGVVIKTVDSAMKAWADYVRSGLATQKEVDLVKAAYNKYRNCQIIAKLSVDAYFAAGNSPDKEAAILSATQSVADAKNALIDLVTSIIHKTI